MADANCTRGCQYCGVEFSAQHGNQRYCSDACHGKVAYRRNSERIARLGLICSMEGCGRSVKGAGLCTKHYATTLRHGAAERELVCPACDRVFTLRAGGQGPVAYCSSECRLSVRRARDQRRSSERRVLVGRGDLIDPDHVFARDGWRCHLCGQRTPKGLRGTNLPNSPELDHVVPLSCGGAHTWGNVRCACKKCNASKGGRAAGQLGFGFAVHGALVA